MDFLCHCVTFIHVTAVTTFVLLLLLCSHFDLFNAAVTLYCFYAFLLCMFYMLMPCYVLYV